jgi:acetylornithine/N-succinyldiaminopimelate aminotransferase
LHCDILHPFLIKEWDVTSSLLPTYARYPLAFARGDGVWLTTAEGERYLDLGGGIAVASLGYSHPHLVQALAEQAQHLWHTSNLFQIPQAERLAARLTAASFADFVFFTNSGAEAVEGAIKTARKYHAVSGHPERFHIITFDGAFHGRTLATIAAGGNEKYIEGFGPKAAGFDKVPFADVAAARAAIGPQTAAILVEPIQGEGGIRVPSRSFLRELRALCDEHGLLLILDEVQSGVGRTGKLFAYELSEIQPDIIAIAKGIGGGFPLGAFLTTSEAGKGMTAGTHGTTFGGNPLATAVGNAVLDVVLAPGFIEGIGAKGLLLKQGLTDLAIRFPSVITEVRGEGLMLGLQLRVAPADFAAAGRQEHVLVIPAADNVVRLIPPLIISDAEIAQAVSRLAATCAHFAATAVSQRGAAE